jgi:hypothetical protein
VIVRRLRDEDGVVGGLEVLPFGVLIFVVGTLMVANAWGVIDAKIATSAAAREAVRAYVEAPAASEAADRARAAAAATLSAYGRDEVSRRQIIQVGAADFLRCSPVTWEVRYTVPAAVVPWLGRVGSGVAVRARHTEIVDPLRSGVPGEAGCVR